MLQTQIQSADRFLLDDGAARAYCTERRHDALELAALGLLELPYVKVSQLLRVCQPTSRVAYLVDGRPADTVFCALAFVLAKFW